MSTLEYKGYKGSVEYSLEDRVFHGRIEAGRDMVTYEADTADELEASFRDAVDHYLDSRALKENTPPREQGGKFLVRTTPSLHRQIAEAAGAGEVSMNRWVVNALKQAVAKDSERDAS